MDKKYTNNHWTVGYSMLALCNICLDGNAQSNHRMVLVITVQRLDSREYAVVSNNWTVGQKHIYMILIQEQPTPYRGCFICIKMERSQDPLPGILFVSPHPKIYSEGKYWVVYEARLCLYLSKSSYKQNITESIY